MVILFTGCFLSQFDPYNNQVATTNCDAFVVNPSWSEWLLATILNYSVSFLHSSSILAFFRTCSLIREENGVNSHEKEEEWNICSICAAEIRMNPKGNFSVLRNKRSQQNLSSFLY